MFRSRPFLRSALAAGLLARLLAACGGGETAERVEPVTAIADRAPPPRASGSDEAVTRAPRAPQRYEAPSERAALDAWLAERWPDTPVHVADPALVERLSSWAAAGETRVWMRNSSASGDGCRPATLSVVEGGADVSLAVVVDETRAGGRRTRTLRRGAAGPELVLAERVVEVQEAGRWVAQQGSAGASGSEGVLTEVDERVARYGGRRVAFALACGTHGYIACSGGGERWCNLCQTLSLFAFAPGGGHGQESIPPDSASQARCDDPCPDFEHPDRLAVTRALAAHVLWQPADPTEAIPALFRARADCLRDAMD